MASSMTTCNTITRHYHQADGQVTLDYDARHRRRMALTSDEGIMFLLDLPHAQLLRHGDGLLLDDGRIIAVVARPEPLMEVRGRDTRHLLALCWQIGNRHLAAQIEPMRVLIRRDHVIRDMLVGLGAAVMDVDEAFDPEGGAYDGGHHHHHGH